MHIMHNGLQIYIFNPFCGGGDSFSFTFKQEQNFKVHFHKVKQYNKTAIGMDLLHWGFWDTALSPPLWSRGLAVGCYTWVYLGKLAVQFSPKDALTRFDFRSRGLIEQPSDGYTTRCTTWAKNTAIRQISYSTIHSAEHQTNIKTVFENYFIKKPKKCSEGKAWQLASLDMIHNIICPKLVSAIMQSF